MFPVRSFKDALIKSAKIKCLSVSPCPMCDFNHLHCHTRFSLLDGAANIKVLAQKAKELDMAGVAITDHGNLYGVRNSIMNSRKSASSPSSDANSTWRPPAWRTRTTARATIRCCWRKTSKATRT